MCNYSFICPACGKKAGVEEITLCEGVISEVTGFHKDKNGNFCGCECKDGHGYGEIVNVIYQCTACGAELNFVYDNNDDCEIPDCITLKKEKP